MTFKQTPGPLNLAFTPTKNRRLNEFVGLVLLVSSILLLLALVSYRPTDASLDTVSGLGNNHSVHNWAGVVGANTSDVLLQIEGVAALLLPVLLGILGWSWLRSRATASPWAKVTGVALYVIFAPAFFGLLPGQMHWMGAVPVAGLTGRLLVDFLVSYLNFPGTCVIVFSVLAVSIYLTTAFSFTSARAWLAVQLSYWYALRDRWTNWKMARARRKVLKQGEKDRDREEALQQRQQLQSDLQHDSLGFDQPEPAAEKRSFFHWFRRGRDQAAALDQDSGPMPLAPRNELVGMSAAQEPAAYIEAPASPASVWESIPRAQVPDPEPDPEPDFFFTTRPAPALPTAAAVTSLPEARTTPPTSAPTSPQSSSQSITFTERADIETRSITTTPKALSGYRLPPSSLLHRSEDMAEVREEELREEARVLVEKCAEFDVGGQVTQINPGPGGHDVRVSAGSRGEVQPGHRPRRGPVPGDARGEHPDRAHGRQEHGRHPGAEPRTRETIWLRDVIEADNFTFSASRS